MGQNFKLVQRLSKPGNSASEKKWHAASKSNGTADLNELCFLIASRSTVSSADVKAVLDNLNFVIDYQLKAGRIVQLGELGNFRMSVSSEGAETKDSFTPSMLRTPKIIFTPGAALQETRITTKFSQISDGTGNAGNTEESENTEETPGDI